MAVRGEVDCLSSVRHEPFSHTRWWPMTSPTKPQRRDWTPAVLAFSPAVLLPLTQNVVRPHVHHPALLVLVLGSAPNLIVGFCFPFSILMRPSVWARSTADALFALWCAFTLSMLIAVEYLSPFGRNIFDPRDILASVAGVMFAIALYGLVLRTRLAFAAPELRPT